MNKVLVISVCAWAVAQMLKVFVILIREKRLDLSYFFTSGGMPSAHSATVCALATAVAMIEGLSSVAFAIAMILAIIVMYDAAGVRRAVSRQASVLNRIVKEFRIKRSMGEVERDLRELIGHTPFQVIIGSALGIIIAWLWLTIGVI
jgi:acid phosphatase family membrane protein YuiD